MRLRARLRRAVALLGLGALLAVSVALFRGGEVVFVASGESVPEALSGAPTGATVKLGPGVHQGPLVVRRALVIEGTGRSIVRAPTTADAAVSIRADDVVVRNLHVKGGWTGILVEHARGVTIDQVAVSGADLHGILIAAARARVSGAEVSGLVSPYAQGVEVFDSPGTVIEDSRLSGGQEGIATFLSHGIRVARNFVTDTTRRAIAINEMSAGTVEGNIVEDAAGVGLYCGDMSHCAFLDNRVDEVAPGRGGHSAAGWGLAVEYHAVGSSEGDQLAGARGPVGVFTGSRMANRSPLELGSGWKAIVPALLAGAIALAVLLIVGALVSPLRSHLFANRSQRARAFPTTAVGIALGVGIAVQTFHLTEHFVQVFRVHADGVPSRGGIVGPVVDAEWIHFAYNAGVFLMLGIIAMARTRGWTPPGNSIAGDRWLMAGLAVQGYHVVEHTVKVFQHVVTGAKVNPGLLGGEINLVWLHFAINLAVYVAFVGAYALYIRSPRAGFKRVAHA